MEKRLLLRIQSAPASSYKRGASERQIEAAQKRLQVRFPPSYQQFLRHFNGGEFPFARMYRISRGGGGFFDLVESMEMASAHFAPFRERELLLFGDDYSGNHYCFDLTRPNRRGECPVVFWDRLMSEKRGPEPQAANLREFLLREMAHFREMARRDNEAEWE